MTVPEDALSEAAEQLYGAPPADFMSTRTTLVAQARAAKNRPLATAISKLRKPSNGAAVMNALVRARPELMEEIASLGAQLRAAQANLHGTALSALRPNRDRLLAEVAAGAGEVAAGIGVSFTAGTEAEVRDTIIAALADAEATAALASGALTRTLSYSGFGEVDLADAVVATSTGRLLRLLAPVEAATADKDLAGEAAAGGTGSDPGAGEDPETGDAEPEDAEIEDAAVDDQEPEGTEVADAEPEDAQLEDTEPEETATDEDSDDASTDHDALIEEAAAAYAEAASAVAAAKRAVAEGSSRLDAAKSRVSGLQTELASAETELAALFEQDARAREGVAAAVKARQRAADLLARREAAGS